MAQAQRNPRRGNAPAVPSVESLIRATIIDLKLIASNSKGKMKYLEDLDAVLEEIYGIKHMGSKFCSGKKQTIDKLISRINFKSLVLMLKGSVPKTKGLLKATVAAHSKLDDSFSRTSKETKKDAKVIKTACNRLRRAYHIEKYRDPSDISIGELKDFLKQSDGYGYYDDDDDYDYDYECGYYDDDDYYSSRDIDFGSAPSAIEKLFDKYKSNDEYYDRGIDCDADDDDDDENDEIRSAISTGEIANQRVDTLISKVINPMLGKVDDNQRYIASIDEKLDRLISASAPVQRTQTNNYVPLPKERATPNVQSGDPQLMAISKALGAINTRVARTGEKIDYVGAELGKVSDVVRGLVNDVYGDDSGDDDDDIDERDLISMDDVNASFTGIPAPAPEEIEGTGFHKTASDTETPPPPTSPISLKQATERYQV